MFFQIVRGKFKIIKLVIDACAKKMRQRDSWKMRQCEVLVFILVKYKLYSELKIRVFIYVTFTIPQEKENIS